MNNDDLRKLAEVAAAFGRHDPEFDMSNPDYLRRATTAHRAFADKAPPAKIIELLDTIEQQRKLLEQAGKLLNYAHFGALASFYTIAEKEHLVADIANHLRQQEGEKK